MASLTPDQIKRMFAKARAARDAGRLADAAKAFSILARKAPKLAEVHFNLGEISALRGEVADASKHFETALKLKPLEPAIWMAYLELASRLPSPVNLKKLLGRVGTSFDALGQIWMYRGMVAANAGDPKAVELFRKAESKGYRTARLYATWGGHLAATGQDEDALALFDKAIDLSPKIDEPYARKAELLRSMGRFDEALEAARKTIDAAPHVGPHYYTYASITKMTPDDPMIGKMQAALKGKTSRDQGTALLAALSKAMEDIGQNGQMFGYLRQANDRIAEQFGYDHEADQRDAARVRDVYQAISGAIRSANNAEKKGPIFVTGMPRSGTTLVEQIISSHSSVAGGGELGLMSGKLSSIIRASEKGLNVVDMQASLANAGDAYLETVSERFPDATLITDKSISTYVHMGLIRMALPDARIVVVRRDPRDNALSLYKNMFRPGLHRYSTKLESIAQFYHLFETQLAFWAEQDDVPFHEIRYEDLIADPEGQSRALVSAAGLEWEDACLSFYDNKRRVDTLSATQVRQPIYSSSVGGWRRFEDELAPFMQTYTDLGGDLD